ncbi:MAG: alanyl-tRNA editing protein, partial [Spirochaetales bacterium]|nr:alanyl-tRNA editing protein [Candidatus Physcosoma equi]
MTELLYYKDAYLKETEATVIDIRKGGVVLDKTIFYPECGGQPGDRGTFGLYVIKDTQKEEDGTPLHLVEGENLPAVGDTYTLTLDWDHRYQYMKEHTAQHLLSATLFHEAQIGTVAVHQGEEILTIETERGDIPDETLLLIEDIANRHINENLKVWQSEMSHKEAEDLGMRRSIKVDGDVKV